MTAPTTHQGPSPGLDIDRGALGTTRPTTLLSIGRLAGRSAIRFCSDEGVLPETDRSSGGYRRFDARAVARVELVRTLRELGLGLDDVRLVPEHRRSVVDVTAAHVHAVDRQILAPRRRPAPSGW